MNTELASACQCFGLYDEDNIVGFIGVLHQPHPKNKRLKRGSRLVILPDYQGIGLGSQFSTLVGRYYNSQGYDYCFVASAKNLILKTKMSEEWVLKNVATTPKSTKVGAIDYNRKSMRTNNKTARFVMRANRNEKR